MTVKRCKTKGARPRLRRGVPYGSGFGTTPYVVERALALLYWFRRLCLRWERRREIREAFLHLGCALICWRRLRQIG